MRDYVGVDISSLPPATAPDFQPRVRRIISDIDYFLRDLNKGIGRISNGEVPDGSGNPIGGGGTLTDYWFKPGISDPFIAYMSTGSGQGGNISSTIHDTKGFIKLGYPTPVEYVDEANRFVGINVAAPAASLHLQSGVSGTTTLIPTTSVVHNWDTRNRTGVGGTDAGAFTIDSLKTSDDYTLYNGVGTLGSNPETVGMGDGTSLGVITPNKVWTCTFRVACLGTTVTNDGDAEFHIVDSTGAKYSATSMTGLLNGLGTTFTDYTFTINGAGTSTGSGTANTVIIGLNGKVGVTPQYIACTYFQITTGGSSDIARWNNEGGTGLLGKITKDGYVGIGTNGDTLGAMLTVECDSATQIGEKVVGATSQSGDLTQWRSQSSLLSRIKSDGTFDGPISTTSAISVTDNAFSILDDVTPTKIAQFQCSGLSVGTRTFTFPDTSDTLAVLGTQQFTAVQKIKSGDANFALRVINDSNADTISLATNGTLTTSAFSLKDALATGFIGSFAPDGTWTQDFSIILPEATSGSGTMVLASDSTVFFNVLLGLVTRMKSSTSSTGACFEDTTTSSKKLRAVLSGAVGNNSITLTNTAARNYGLGNLSGNIPVVGDDPPAVASGALGKVDLTAQTAGIGSTNLSNTPPAGLYRVDVYAACTTASGSGAPTLDVNIAWTDVVGATNQNCVSEPSYVTKVFPLDLAATGRTAATMFIQVASGNIAYSTTINAASGSPQYAIYIRVTYLG